VDPSAVVGTIHGERFILAGVVRSAEFQAAAEGFVSRTWSRQPGLKEEISSFAGGIRKSFAGGEGANQCNSSWKQINAARDRWKTLVRFGLRRLSDGTCPRIYTEMMLCMTA
jgi:hypothetical protein